MVKSKCKSKRAQKQAKRRLKKTNKKSICGRTKKSHALQIGPNTPHGICSERLSAFGGLLALVKFLDLVKFREVFEKLYVSPKRKTELGCYGMVQGLLMLLFIGFQRIGHFKYVREDSMLCGILKVSLLPVVSTFWRYLRSLTIIQSQSLLRIIAELRVRVWQLVGYQPERVSINIDTTVATVYGEIEGARKGHNRKHRGKKGLRPVLCFIDQTREYLCGTQRRGETITGREIARQIRRFRGYLPQCVKEVHVRADAEFIGWESVRECEDSGCTFTFGNRRCTPQFPKEGWYKYEDYEYNECMYQPTGWEEPCRFVVMRIAKEEKGERQLTLIEGEEYVYRVFATNMHGRPHEIIADYDRRADVENSIGEAQREGVLAIPSRKFLSNHAYFQIVMLAYNLWRWIKQAAGHRQKEAAQKQGEKGPERAEIVDNTIRVARLKMLYVAAKIISHGNRSRVYYSMHESRASGLGDFLEYLDRRRREGVKWSGEPGRSRRRAVS